MRNTVVLATAALLLTASLAHADSAWTTTSSKWVDVPATPTVTAPHYAGGSWASPTPADYVIEARSASEMRAKALQESGYNQKNDFDEYGNVSHN